MDLKKQPKYAQIGDLGLIADCHMAAFPKSFFSRLGKDVSLSTLSWYLDSKEKFLIWIEHEGTCVGYLGAMLSDGTQPHGSTSGMIQHSFYTIVKSLIKRPWLFFHPDLLSRYRLILKNIWNKAFGSKPMSSFANRNASKQRRMGLVVIGVNPNYQKMGLGSILLKEFEAISVSFNVSVMSLTVSANNTHAIKSYERNGWRAVRKKGKYWLMEKAPVSH